VHGLDPALALDLCDVGERRSPFERALLLLEAGCTDSDQLRGAPGEWPLGAVNQAMLQLRAATFGRRMELLADCPACGAICESQLDCLDIAAVGAVPARQELRLSKGTVEFRLPTCPDIIEAANSDERPGRALARKLICTGDVELDDPALGALSDAVARADPLAFIEIALQCPECDDRWSEPLHIADLLWTELRSCADRLVFDVARLAQAFGWRENDILSMSAPRRQRYLDLLPS